MVADSIQRRRDRDWFRVDLEAGKSYRIEMAGETSGDGTLLRSRPVWTKRG